MCIRDRDSIDTDFDVDEYLYDDEPSYKTSTSNYSADDEDYDNESLLTEGQSLYEYLMEQIHLVNIEDDDLKIAEYIIGNPVSYTHLDVYKRQMVSGWIITSPSPASCMACCAAPISADRNGST